MVRPAPAIWLTLAGGVVLWVFMAWENRRIASGAEPLINPAILHNSVLRGGLAAFFFQYLLQDGLFFVVPLFLSVALGLSAIATGVRLLPLSITLLLAAASLSVLAVIALIALFFTRRIPTNQPAVDPSGTNMTVILRPGRCGTASESRDT